MTSFGDYVDDLTEAAHDALADPMGRGRAWLKSRVVYAAPGQKVNGRNLIVVGPAVRGTLEDSFVASPDADVTVRNSVVAGNNARVRSRGGNVVRGKDVDVRAARSSDRVHVYDVKRRADLSGNKKRSASPATGKRKRTSKKKPAR